MKQTEGNTKVKQTRMFVQAITEFEQKQTVSQRHSTIIFSGVLSKITSSKLYSTGVAAIVTICLYIGAFFKKIQVIQLLQQW